MVISDKYLEETRKKKISDEMIKKDLALSYILYGMFEDIRENKNSPFSKLIFKGGTLLSKSHLKYHRISEDLDFTFSENKTLNKLSKFQKRKKIKKYLKEEFLPNLKKIVDKYSFDFDPLEMENQESKKYCPIKSPVDLAKFYIYISEKDQIPIKIEINFCDELFYGLKKSKITHLNPSSEHLIYPLENLELESYVIEEILLEKLRAIITRKESVHERDIYDLFLLSKEDPDPLKIDPRELKNKIIQGIGYRANKIMEKKHILELQKRFEELEKNLEEEIKEMNLTDYDSDKYKKFFNKIKDFVLSMDFSDL
jgi:predicted nucleotidyltransferase component of viral defense system